MKIIELLDMLTSQAKEFRKDHDHYNRNRHMHAITECPPQEVIDAVLTGFINQVGRMQCVDYALYARDLSKDENPKVRGGAQSSDVAKQGGQTNA